MSLDAPTADTVLPAAIQDGSPWSSSPTTGVSIHWREDRGTDPNAATLEDSIAVHLAGVVGTVIAGALFPLAVAITVALFSFRPGSLFRPEAILWLLIIGTVVGGLFAGLAATAMFPLAGLVQYLAGLSRWRAIVASIAGGWSGLAATFAMTHSEQNLSALPLQLGAMVMGQLGAGYFAGRVHRAQVRGFASATADEPVRLNLRQLFGIMSAVAIIAAIIANLPLSGSARASLGIALAIQGSLTAVIAFASDLLHRGRLRHST